MMFMICWRVTPSLAVRMTITSVVLGDGGLVGGWAEGDCDCAMAANGDAERMNGGKSFMDAPRINMCRPFGFWRVPLRLGSSRLPAHTTTWCSQMYSPPLSERWLSALPHRGFLL